MSDLLPARTRLEVVERPTWFGPAESPLFGVAHLPADQKVRGAVLVCGSLGKDHADVLRALRLLGNELAARGLLVFRFDYLGSGDSSFDQTRPDAVGDWQASIGHALDYLRAAGVTDISAVAVRAGSVILDSVLDRYPSITRVVYWDPVGSGQRYLREQTSFFKIAVGTDDVPPGVVSTIGARLAPEAAKEFAALTLGADGGPAERLVITRSEGYDKNVKALVGDAGTTTVLVDGFTQCAQPSRLLVPISLDAVDAATEWLDQQVGQERTPVTMEFTDSARIPVTDGVVVEQIERISPYDMFAIRTLPESGASDSVVMFFTNANNPHHGPNREWVELARAVAAQGRLALRWDRRGAGEHHPRPRRRGVRLFRGRRPGCAGRHRLCPPRSRTGPVRRRVLGQLVCRLWRPPTRRRFGGVRQHSALVVADQEGAAGPHHARRRRRNRLGADPTGPAAQAGAESAADAVLACAGPYGCGAGARGGARGAGPAWGGGDGDPVPA